MEDYYMCLKSFSKENNISENQVTFLLSLCENNFNVLKSVIEYYKYMITSPPADVETFNQYLAESIVWRVCKNNGITYHRPYISHKKVSYNDIDQFHEKNVLDYKKIMHGCAL